MARDLLFELGAEEIPASFIEPALEYLSTKFKELAEGNRLAHGEIQTFGTPRRLALLVKGVADASSDVVKDVQGPSAKAAFDKDGKPTMAAEKFAQSVKLTVDKLSRVTTPKGEYLSAKVEEKGRPAPALLAEVLHQVAHGIPFKKQMRWGDTELSFARPLHWIVALFGDEVVPVVFGDVKSGRTTFGHRFLSPQGVTVKSPADWEPALKAANVIPRIDERKALLRERLAKAAGEAGGKILEDDSLVDQVTNLVELPSPVVGSFDEKHLDLPPEVLVQEMKSHQRYFSLQDSAGKLLPRFIAVSNTPVKDVKLSLRGYERVLRARLSDGRYFFDEDRRQKLAERLPKLERVVWFGKLGSYAEKTKRIAALAGWLADAAGKGAAKATALRAAELCKADLVTGMVGEFPELQGVMGREYAKASGETAEVAQAIFEHYLPRGATDGFPQSDAGALVGLADRLDSLASLFGIGKRPTGANDPLGLRRAALAVINLILEKGYRFSLSAALGEALSRVPADQVKAAFPKAQEPSAEAKKELLSFFRDRIEASWKSEHRADVVNAVLSAGFDDLVAAKKRLDAMASIVGQADFAPLAVAFKRVANIVEKQGKDVQGGKVNEARLADDAERALHHGYEKAKASVTGLVKQDEYRKALAEITSLKPAVDTFFDKVMVMAEDKDLRENRIRLLVEIGALFNQVADFSKIQAE